MDGSFPEGGGGEDQGVLPAGGRTPSTPASTEPISPPSASGASSTHQGAGGEQPKAVTQLGGDLIGGQHAHARGRELDRQAGSTGERAMTPVRMWC